VIDGEFNLLYEEAKVNADNKLSTVFINESILVSSAVFPNLFPEQFLLSGIGAFIDRY
jgi:hypothetical protein